MKNFSRAFLAAVLGLALLGAATKIHLKMVDGPGGQGTLDQHVSGYVNVKSFGAKGDGITDDTASIQAAGVYAATNGKGLDFGSGTYAITSTNGVALLVWTAKSNVHIRGDGAKLVDSRVHSGDTLTPVFLFDACHNVRVEGVEYEGAALAAPETNLGYLGATFVRAINGTTNVTVDAKLSHARYGVQSGEYADETKGNCKGFNIRLTTYRVGYPVAMYLAEDVTADVNADGVHRSVYLAGVQGARIDVASRNQYIANVNVLLTDAKTGAGTSRGSSGITARARDTGSTVYQPGASLFGLNPSRADAGIVFRDLSLHGEVTGTDTIAATVGLYQQTATVNNTLTVNGLRLSGVVDRSAQTTDPDTTGIVYINATNAGAHQTIRGLVLRDLVIRPSPANTRASYIMAPGAVERILMEGVSSPGLGWNLATSGTVPVEIKSSTLGDIGAGGTGRVTLVRSSVTSIPAAFLVGGLEAWEATVAGSRRNTTPFAVSADRSDTSQTLTAGVDAPIQRWATVLSNNRTITLSTTGAVNGDVFRIVRTGLGAFTLDVGPGLKTIPSATAAWVDVAYNGAAWVLTGYGTL